MGDVIECTVKKLVANETRAVMRNSAGTTQYAAMEAIVDVME